MGMIRDFFEKVSHYFNKEEYQDEESSPAIEIYEWHDESSNDIPQITIGEVHRRDPDTIGSNVYRSEIDVQNQNLGHGIIVKKQHKPGRCPLCATQGKIVGNNAGSDRWKCEECGSTFN